jgi:hypothetical protein
MSSFVAVLWAWSAMAADPAPTPPPVEGPSTEALQAEIQALRRQIEVLTVRSGGAAALAEGHEAELAALEAELAALRADLAAVSAASIVEEDLTFDLEGDFRTRAYAFPNLFLDQDGGARYMQSRLRLRPIVSYKDLAKVVVQVDAMEDVVWGDNASLASTSLFAGDPSYTGVTGTEVPSIQLTRAWMEARVPVGVIRAGRQESHWGLGLLANDGLGFDDTFGENHNNTTFDRVLFATRPVAIAQAAMGKNDSNVPFYLVFAVDRLVEDPLFQYYGFKCEAGVLESDPDYNPDCDTDGDGVTDVDHSFVDETRTGDQRTQDWWADSEDDVVELVWAAIYRGQDIHYLGGPGDFTFGTYFINRYQNETDSNVLIVDAYLDAKWRSLVVQFEGLGIFGDTSAIALQGSYDPTDDTDPLAKTANIWGYVGRVGYQRADWSAWMEHGYASGDNYTADADFTGRPLAPDHNVGLIMYEEVIARVTAQLWSEGAAGLWSQGGVYNSRYFFPNVRYSPIDNWDVILAGLVAFPDKPDGAIIKCKEGDNVDCAQYDATASMLGWEIDAALKHRWHEHVLFSLESGFAHATDRLPLEQAGLNPEGNFFTLQSRLAYEF